MKLHEVYESKSFVYLVLKKWTETNLLNGLKHLSYYTEIDIKKIMKSLLETVAHLHNNKIIHRDIKPHNLILM